jgi:hypothetical protein
MNRKFALTLLSSPTLFASIMSMVMMTQPVHAGQAVIPAGTNVACVPDSNSATPRMICQRVSNKPAATVKPEVKVPPAQPNQVIELEFTEQESDEAIAKYGCDCPVCINAIRKLNGLPEIPV